MTTNPCEIRCRINWGVRLCSPCILICGRVLASDIAGQTRCLILDVAMPGMNGLDLQRELKDRGLNIPIIFITAQKDEALRARAFAQGAVEFLFKPFSDTALLDALNTALGKN